MKLNRNAALLTLIENSFQNHCFLKFYVAAHKMYLYVFTDLSLVQLIFLQHSLNCRSFYKTFFLKIGFLTLTCFSVFPCKTITIFVALENQVLSLIYEFLAN